MTITASPAERDVVCVGTEPSEVLRRRWDYVGADRQVGDTVLVVGMVLSAETGHSSRSVDRVSPAEPGTAVGRDRGGALVSSIDSGRTRRDRVPGGPYDTHELAIQPKAPNTLRVSARDGYFESDHAGATWRSPNAGLEVGYLRSVAIDPEQPEVTVVSASSGPYSAYVAGRSDGR